MVLSRAFYFFLLSFLAGIFISSFFNLPLLLIDELFALAIFYGVIFFREKTILVFSGCLFFLALGLIRMDLVKPLGPLPTAINSFRETRQGEINLKIEEKIEERLLPFKERTKKIIESVFSPPHSSLLEALLLGETTSLSAEWKDKLNRAGLRHTVVVSGMHIVLVSTIFLWLGLFFGLNRAAAIYFALLFLWLFVAFTGFQPSAIRAGIMGSLLLFCQKLGRQNAAGRSLILSAVLMLAFQPALLRQNVGFQLSFLATAGLIYFYPIFQNLFSRLGLRKEAVKSLTDLLAMTLAAQIFTLPILIYNFGYFSLVSPLSNILAVPLLPEIMMLGFFFVFLTFLWGALGWLVYPFLWLLLDCFILVIDFSCRLPLARIIVKTGWVFLLLYYAVLFLFTFSYVKHLKQKRLVGGWV